MTGKENYLNTLLHKHTEWIPVEGEDLCYTGFEFNAMEKGPLGGGKEGRMRMPHVFSKEELEVIKIYPNEDTYYGFPWNEIPKYRTPITPKENLLRFYRGEEYEWVPNLISDCNWIFPDIMPDNYACKMEGGVDALGVTWVPTHPELGLPSITKPGNPFLKSLSEWRDKIIWPDVDSWDWVGSSQRFHAALDTDRANIAPYESGFFERLISLLDFEGAAIVLLEDPDTVREFFDRLVKYHLDVIEHLHKYYHIDFIFMHDDWGSQKAPFFSRATLRETILPAYQAVAERIHELGMHLIMHCCGCSEGFLPEMLEIGGDGWNLQENANPNLMDAIAQYGEGFVFDITREYASDLPLDEFRSRVQEFYNQYPQSCTLCVADEMFSNSLERMEIIYEIQRTAAGKKQG